MTIVSNSLKETQEYAKQFAKTLKRGEVLCFYGDLGSGKTTFIQGLALGLGIENRIISPTFIIVRTYNLNSANFYHIDLYRASSTDDLRSVGIDEILSEKQSIVAIEWAEKLKELLPQKRIELKFETVDKDKRKISIEKYE